MWLSPIIGFFLANGIIAKYLAEVELEVDVTIFF
jgi:hypothetical protein